MELGTVLQNRLSWLKLRTDRRGVTALEYGLIAGVIVGTIMVGFSLRTTGITTFATAKNPHVG